MKLHLYQLQFAVNQAVYDALQDKTMTIENVSMNDVAAILTKEIDIGNQATPHIGEYICDSYWPRDFCEQKIVNICYDYSAETCVVTLEPFVMVAESALHNELERIATSHGWNYQGA